MSRVIAKLVFPILLRVVAFAESPSYFFVALGLVCAKALPATDLVFALVRPSRSKRDALLATERDVCLGFAFLIELSSFLDTRLPTRKLTYKVQFI